MQKREIFVRQLFTKDRTRRTKKRLRVIMYETAVIRTSNVRNLGNACNLIDVTCYYYYYYCGPCGNWCRRRDSSGSMIPAKQISLHNLRHRFSHFP